MLDVVERVLLVRKDALSGRNYSRNMLIVKKELSLSRSTGSASSEWLRRRWGPTETPVAARRFATRLTRISS